MDQNPIRVAPGASTDERAPSFNPAGGEAAAGADPLAFDPVHVSYRTDGWTPEKQAEFVEALADLGVVKWAAARVGMTEQSAGRLRRRPDARSFDLACAAAQRIGARRLVSLAFERAIAGSVKRHYFRGEMVGEERVYDNRLLTALLPRLLALTEPTPEVLAVEENWGAFVGALARGEEPAAAERCDPAAAADEAEEFDGCECWEDDDGVWWTDFPPPDDFEGEEDGSWGEYGYARTLTDAEEAAFLTSREDEDAEELAAACARRDRFFGFAPPEATVEVKSWPAPHPRPRRTGHELSELSAPPRPARAARPKRLRRPARPGNAKAKASPPLAPAGRKPRHLPRRPRVL